MNELAVTLGLISLPGLIAALLADKLVVHTARWEVFKYSIYTFVFGIGSYGLLQLLTWLLHAFDLHLPLLADSAPLLTTWHVLTFAGGQPKLAEIAWATVLSPFLALIAILAVNRKWLNRLAQKLKVSAKFGDENLFSFYLNLQNVEWVYVRDIPNNLSYRGKIYSFSETPALQELVLKQVTVYSYKDSDELYQVPMIYLCRPMGAFLIEAAQEAGSSHDKEDNQRGEVTHASEERHASDDERAKGSAAAAAGT